MQIVSCPNCGNPLTYASPALPVKVCDRCQSVVVRRDEGLERIGEAAMLPFDVSPMQIGAMGRHGGIAFTIVGRIRWGWAQGSWNEWLALFDDGSNAWIGEAMGDFMILREAQVTDASDGMLREMMAGRTPQLGTAIIENGIHFVATDVKSAHILASEGELPFRCATDWTINSVDFRSTGLEIASFQSDEDGASFYVGETVSLASLGMYNLRSIEGWTVPVLTSG